jgi:hypothetical protein
MPSDGKSSHCLWQVELKRVFVTTSFSLLLLIVGLKYDTGAVAWKEKRERERKGGKIKK